MLRIVSNRACHTRPLRLKRATLPPMAYPLRPFHQASRLAFPRKDSQHKDDINTEATEYSKSGSDDSSAGQDEAAFDPKHTSPEVEKDIAGKGNEKSGNPLEVSPANRDVSTKAEEHDGTTERRESSSDPAKRKQSGHKSPAKAGKV